jgi:hypothetical protein
VKVTLLVTPFRQGKCFMSDNPAALFTGDTLSSPYQADDERHDDDFYAHRCYFPHILEHAQISQEKKPGTG